MLIMLNISAVKMDLSRSIIQGHQRLSNMIRIDTEGPTYDFHSVIHSIAIRNSIFYYCTSTKTYKLNDILIGIIIMIYTDIYYPVDRPIQEKSKLYSNIA